MADTKQTAGGVQTPSPVLVSCDQITILGDGSHERPLHAGTLPDPGTIRAAFSGNGKQVGTPVAISLTSLPGGDTTVRATDIRALAPSDLDFAKASTAFGVVKALNADGTVQVATAGVVTLTTAQWNAVTGDSGGLVLGDPYYAASEAGGSPFLSNVAPAGVGKFTTLVGVALSSTELLVSPSAPVQNLGDSIAFGTFLGTPPPLGGAMIVGAANQFEPVLNGATIVSCQGVGLLAALDHAGNPIVQFAGIVTLTEAQWLAATDTNPGMQPGVPYYAVGSAFHGQLTHNSPSTGLRVQMVVGLSSTQAIISPYLQNLGGT